MTQHESFVRLWQKKLRLQDWDIAYKEVKSFKAKNQSGATTVTPKFQWAAITIKKGLSWPEFKRTAVHELLHIRFGGMNFEEGSEEDFQLEVAIEMTVRALLGEKR